MLKNLFSIILTTLFIAGAVLVIAVMVGMTLPETTEAARSARFKARPAAVFSVISTIDRYPQWRSDVTRVEVLPDDGGGVLFKEYGRENVVTYRIEESEAPLHMRVRVADDSVPFGGSWTFVLQPFEDGTSLTITEEGTIGNPLYRVAAKVLFSATDSIDRYLSDLAAVAELRGR